MRYRTSALCGLAGLWVALLCVLSPAASAYPAAVCSTLSVSTTNPLPGASITVGGLNFRANASVRLVLHSKAYYLETVDANARGSFTTTVRLPAGLTGHHLIRATTGAKALGDCPADPFQSFTIQSVDATSTSNGGGTTTNSGGSGGLSSTGLDIAALLALAGGLVGAGVLLNRRNGRRLYTGEH